MIRVELPSHLRTLARVSGDIDVNLNAPVTLSAVLDDVERQYQALAGTIRDQVTKERRAFIRFFACGEDLSHAGKDVLLPAAVACGREPLLVIGAIAGG